MKAKDLMVGDYVYRPDCYTKVKEVRENGILELDYLRSLIGFNELEPIPLTPDILEKNDFRGDESGRWELLDRFTEDKLIILYEIANGFTLSTEGLDIGIQYVHELQHLFSLFGMDKEIVL